MQRNTILQDFDSPMYNISNTPNSSSITKQLSGDEVSLIITTYKRPEWIERQLKYLWQKKFKFSIYILNGSPIEYGELYENIINRYSSLLTLHYTFSPNQDGGKRVLSCLENVTSPYVIINCDDDFIIPEIIEQGIFFLNKNSDYVLYHGRAMVYYLDNPEPHGRIIRLTEYDQNHIPYNSALERVVYQMVNFNSTYHSITRAEICKKSWEAVVSSNFDIIFAELAASIFSVIHGKVKREDDVYLLREGNQIRDYDYNWTMNRLNWIMEPGWSDQYQRFLEKMCYEIEVIDSISFPEVQKYLTIAFWIGYIPQLNWNDDDRGIAFIQALTDRKPSKNKEILNYSLSEKNEISQINMQIIIRKIFKLIIKILPKKRGKIPELPDSVKEIFEVIEKKNDFIN